MLPDRSAASAPESPSRRSWPILPAVPEHAGKSPLIPGGDLDLGDPKVVAGLFDRAARANLDHGGRAGGTQHLPAAGRAMVSGDLHDHGRNLMRLLKLARLRERPHHHLILQELIHGPHRVNGMDLSVRTLARAAALKLDFPSQVHLLLGNHELSQSAGDEILKEGGGVVEAFDRGVSYIYGSGADEVRAAMNRFIASMLLAVRFAQGIMCTHSLPSPRLMAQFDADVIERVPTAADLRSGGSAHMLVWGRRHSQAQADELAQRWGVQQFVLGHQPAEMGYLEQEDTMLILASDHEHGMALPIDLARRYERDELITDLVPLASIVV